MLNVTRINSLNRSTPRVIIIHHLPSTESLPVMPVDRPTGPKAEMGSKIRSPLPIFRTPFYPPRS